LRDIERDEREAAFAARSIEARNAAVERATGNSATARARAADP
jgi:hypothetical protein